MRTIFIYICVALMAFSFGAKAEDSVTGVDTTEIIKLNKQAYEIRNSNPDETVAGAQRALAMAQKAGYWNGVGEAYRVMGIGNYYLNKPEVAIDNYLNALAQFSKAGNLQSEAAVYNNIGNLYMDNDYDQSLYFLQKSLKIAQRLKDNELMAKLYNNIGNIYFRKKAYHQALTYYDKSNDMFAVLKDSVNLIKSLQNRGVIYYSLNQLDKARVLLLQANKQAKEKDLNEPVASIDLTLASLYIDQNKFDDAQEIVAEGLNYANIIKDEKLKHDFNYTNYELEFKRKNYERALFYLRDIYHQDSSSFKTSVSAQLGLLDVKHKQEARDRENQLIIQRQQYDRVKFWAVAVVAGLLLILVGLLISNVKRKAKTNEQLTNLNAEVSRQKDNLDRINHHLEEIIDERTKDLQIKNKKLSEYSSYLSHQIRGPIATLKGLMNLEKEGLVDQAECIKMMNKCVSEIDDKIIEMSDMLHDPVKTSL
ncbi:tetratricopeptide repeat protein [Mucilaginibacter sp. BJC16-A38]|uniref:tetratricopeptide repeat protein n=1 Tax=Mucilaginibacter phenanthrenivorans TaxID=1234842 RepID=UPI002157B79F|nr:tetratricopeptide repeat protein [Mucilaginibacter phenanthrenivorans]MCR8559906.1 tetratricopeptide repeat protein [Mucilaginibacter phenanthrenivorans]